MQKILALFGMLLIWSGTALSQINIAIDPGAEAVDLGNQAAFNIDISGLGIGMALGAYDLSINFDATVLSYANTSFGNQLDLSGLGDIQSVTPNAGSVEIYELSFDAASLLNSSQAPSFTLATLYFDTLAIVNDSPLSLSVIAIGDADGNPLSANTQTSSITVNAPAVPVPAAVWLFSTVLAGFGFLNSRIPNRG